MAKNKKIKQEIEHQVEEEVVISAPVVEETVVEEQPVVIEEQVEEVIPTPVIVKEVIKEEPKQVVAVKETTKHIKPLVCESRHTRMQYAFTQPSLVRHLMINNNF